MYLSIYLSESEALGEEEEEEEVDDDASNVSDGSDPEPRRPAPKASPRGRGRPAGGKKKKIESTSGSEEDEDEDNSDDDEPPQKIVKKVRIKKNTIEGTSVSDPLHFDADPLIRFREYGSGSDLKSNKFQFFFFLIFVCKRYKTLNDFYLLL